MIKFEKLPYPVRAGLAGGLGFKLSVGRYGSEFREFTKFLQESRQYTLSEQMVWQRKELLRLVSSAVSGTEHYRSLNIKDDGDLLYILGQIPLLEKHQLRRATHAFFNKNVKKWLVTSTSGTSGSPMKVEHSKFSTQRRFALLKQQLELAGVDKRAPSVRLSGRIISDPAKPTNRPWLYVPSENQLLLSSYHLNAKHRDVIARKLVRYAPQVMDGYSSGILETLRLLRDAGVQLESLKVIVTTAETLSPDVRSELELLSGAKVLDYYSASEGVPIIQQCKAGVYHVRWESGIFEVMRDGKTHFDGNGELVVTSFTQDRTPLIRYRTGDYINELNIENQRLCVCGLSTPTISGVVGRVEDMVFVRGGRRMGMFNYRTLKEVEGLLEAQIVQKDYDVFEVVAVLSEGVAVEAVTVRVKEKFERVLGYSVSVQVHEVGEIPKGANGKLRSVVNKMS